MFLPLVQCIIDDTLAQDTPDLRRTLLPFIDVMNVISVARFILSTTRQNSDNVLDTLDFCYF